uniref:Translocation and assembly module TamB C-terminal domain-containing protein n=1 Tax=Solibacter usitatus (strain Ellin6076) TaxID=234267 RepID=Q02B21_SOLUE
MSRPVRILLRLAAGLAALLIVAALSIVFVLQSSWFFDKVRAKIVSSVETATGGRVEIRSFRMDWRHMRAEVRDFVIHGTEPAGKPPLFHASSVAVGLKLLTILKPSVDIRYLNVADPQVYLIIAPDGSTNIPAPKLKSTAKTSTVEDILKLAIGTFTLERGSFEVEARSRTPFDARGENLNLNLAYDRAGPRYRGTLAIQPLHLSYDDYGPVPFDVRLGLTLERNRIAVDTGRLATSATQVTFSGAVEDLAAAPRGSFRYEARAALTDIARIFRIPELRAGRAMVGGTAQWTPAAPFTINGNVHATGVEYRDRNVRLVDFRADGAAAFGPPGVDASGLRIAGFYARDKHREPVEGKIAKFTLRKKDIDLDGVALTLLAGSFRGEAKLRNLDSYTVTGELSGIDSRRTIALYSPQELPWDALVFGPVRLEGSLKRSSKLRATAGLRLAPAATGDPVTGEVNATYVAETSTLDLGHSTVSLPHSRVEVSGAIGAELKVHAETTDLNDIIPVLGKNTVTLPVTLRNGSVVFDGSVSGNLENPRIAGHVRAANVTYQAENVDSLEGDVVLAADYLRVQNATAARGAVRAQLQGSLGLSDWKPVDTSPISATGSLRNTSLSEIAAALKTGTLPASGTLNTSVQVNGTFADPRAQAEIEVLKGQLYDEPFDRITAHANYSANRLEVVNGEIAAGPRQVRLSGTLQHAPGQFDTGRLHFEASTNVMAIKGIHAIEQAYPGVEGTLRVSAGGDVDLQPRAPVKYQVHELHADVSAQSVRLNGQALGDARLTAASQGQTLRAHLDSTLAGTPVKGDGEWRLEGDLPGTATVNFARVDFAKLAPWLSSAGTEPPRLVGFIEGSLHLDGPVLDWHALRAELRIPQVQLAPSPEIDVAGGALTVKNAAPVVVRFANSIVTVDSAHFVGRATDLNVTGRILVGQKSPLDLRVDGNVDLGLLEDFSRDFVSSGTVVTNASIKGTFADPQVVGRLEFKNAAFNIVDVPNGLSKTTGVVLFNKDRATIQSLTGETGGGKIDLSGFVSYGSGGTVFRIHARATEVRVRYPEGVSTVANASLNFTGTTSSSMLAGTVTILRTGINLQSDFSSILASSAEPVRTPSARTGLLGGLAFDVQIQTAPDLQLESTLTENLQAEANLRLRGTASNPAILGRINLTQGKLTFFGTQYTLNQGSISFYNPVKVEPILNIDLETKARGIDITLTISGPINKLTLTPRSDPPLQFSEIVALLATGRAPTSDPTLLRQQSSDPQSWQQMGASALLGSAIASPVAGRLQRFFGVSKLRIDPTISGVENSPQARLTLEQQVTPSVTFTYITNVTSSNPQIIRVEWAMSRQFSVVALREENGLFGLDFVYKVRFK